MTTIYLIRHGEIPTSTPRRFLGRRDISLSVRGREQMVKFGSFLSSRALQRVVCSPLSRCLESARILCDSSGHMLTPEPLPPLMEINLGGWDGLTVDEVRQRYPGSYEARGRDLARFCPQGGESFADLLHRSWPVFESIATGTAEHVAVVTHSGVNRVLLCRILGMPLENLFRFGQDYGCLNSIHHDGAGYRLDLLNCRVCRDIR